jgi:hypothetical protein
VNPIEWNIAREEEEVDHVLIFMFLHLSNDMALHPMTR